MKLKLLILLILIVSCSKKGKEIDPITQQKDTVKVLTQEEVRVRDSIETEKKILAAETYPTINYEQIILSTKKLKDSIYSEYKWTRKNRVKNKIFISLNRKESQYLKIGDTIIVPDTIIDDQKAYSVLPHYFPEAEYLDKVVIVSNYYQCYGAYEKGKLVHFAAVNSGKEKTPTYPGRYALHFRQKKRHSSTDSNWVLPYYFNFHRYAGMAFHQFAMPGYPASHACVRQFMSDAEWLYKWGKGSKVENRKALWLSGTPVIIVGVPDYSRRKGGPWSELKSNKERPLKLRFDPMEVEEAWIPLQQISADIQDWVPNRKRYKVSEDTLRARGIIAPHVKLTASVNFNKKRREEKQKKLKDSLKKIEELKKLDPELFKNDTNSKTKI